MESIEEIFERLIQTEYNISEEEQEVLDIIINNAENRKAALAVIITSLYKKIITPSQDTRYHQSNLPDGYSGRSLDEHEITPFLKQHNFPAMASSGWLTRSFEQNVPYNEKYTGKITPRELKCAFLKVFYFIEVSSKNPELYLCYLFNQLVRRRESRALQIVRPQVTQIISITRRLEQHFNDQNYRNVPSTSRLPVLCIYALYQIMIKEFKKFSGMRLAPLQSHTTADLRKGATGDIEIIDNDNNLFEALEIKHGKKITEQMLEDSYRKFSTSSISQYYFLTTSREKDDLSSKIREIKNRHGCQVIVNGVIDTAEYYLRNISDLSLFVENYAQLLEDDDAIKYEHKKIWNEMFR